MRHFPSPDIGMFGRRQRHVRGHRIPVSITCKASANDGSKIVVDTFGADDVVPLPGGCSCCKVRAQLQSALFDLLSERRQKPFSRVTIQTGEDPGPILRTFASERALAGEYYVENAPPLDGERFVLTEDATLSWDAFSRFVTTLAALRGPDVLQAGGLLNVEGCRGPVAVQFMGHLAARPVELQTWPNGGRASLLKFVTRNIAERTVRELFDALCAVA
jgi:G3E family GTPase